MDLPITTVTYINISPYWMYTSCVLSLVNVALMVKYVHNNERKKQDTIHTSLYDIVMSILNYISRKLLISK